MGLLQSMMIGGGSEKVEEGAARPVKTHFRRHMSFLPHSIHQSSYRLAQVVVEELQAYLGSE